MRTLVVSDLHLGGSSGVDVLRHEPVRARLLEELARVDRLVLLAPTISGRLSFWINAFVAPITMLERHAIASRALAALEPYMIGVTDRLMRPASFAERSEISQADYERLRADVMLRVATLDGIQPAALKELNEVLSRVLSGNANLKKSALGGARTAAEILNYLAGSVDTAIIDSIKEHDPELAQQIVDEMFVFENIIDIDDRGIQLLLREVQSDSLVIALKGTSAQLREKIFRNMSQRAAELLKEDLEAKGPVRVSEVEAEQKEILKIVRRLVEEVQIVLSGKGEESYVV